MKTYGETERVIPPRNELLEYVDKVLLDLEGVPVRDALDVLDYTNHVIESHIYIDYKIPAMRTIKRANQTKDLTCPSEVKQKGKREEGEEL